MANIERWKIKDFIKMLEAVRGNGTLMLSLILPPDSQLSTVDKALQSKYDNESSRESMLKIREYDLNAITSAQKCLKQYSKMPSNGLVLFAGTSVTDDGEEEMITFHFEPFRPISERNHYCLYAKRFRVDGLSELLDDKFGFIVITRTGTLFGTLIGDTREVLKEYGLEHNHVRKAGDFSTELFINPATNQPNVSGLILAVLAEYKTLLCRNTLPQLNRPLFVPCLKEKILDVVVVSDGGEAGFNQAIELSSKVRSNVKLIVEKNLIGKYFEEIIQDTGRCVYGVEDTLKALVMGAVEVLIVLENLDMTRYELRNTATAVIIVKHLTQAQEADQSQFRDSTTNVDYKVEDKTPFLKWLVNNYSQWGCSLEFVTNKSQVGAQFCRDFEGIGGFLRDSPDLRKMDVLRAEEKLKDEAWSCNISPCLVICHGDEEKPLLTYYDASQHTFHTRTPPELAHKYVCAACYGIWLLVQDIKDGKDICLVNGVTMQKILLPRIHKEEFQLDTFVYFFLSNSLDVNDGDACTLYLLSEAAPRKPEYILLSCKIGVDDHFTEQEVPKKGTVMTSGIIFKGRIYYITIQGGGFLTLYCSSELQYSSSPLQFTECINQKIKYNRFGLHLCNLVGSGDQLFYIQGRRLDDKGFMDFDIFRADFATKTWEVVFEFESGYSVFVDSFRAFSAPTPPGCGLRGNSIYYTSDELHDDGIFELYEFSLKVPTNSELPGFPFKIHVSDLIDPQLRWICQESSTENSFFYHKWFVFHRLMKENV